MGRRRVTFEYVNSFVDRHGKTRHYFRRNGIRTPIQGTFGSQEFKEHYAQLLAESEETKPKSAARPAIVDGSFAALAAKYYASPSYRALSQSSRKNYRWVIDDFNKAHGHRLVRQMTRDKVDAIIGGLSHMPGKANVLLKRIRTLINYALALKWITADPTLGAKLYRSVEIHTWTEKEIAQFEAKWPTGTRKRLAFALLLYTGQRGSDVHRMTWADISGDMIAVAQQKTKTKIEVVLHEDLRRELALAPRKHVTILNTEFGAPFTVKGFGNMMSDAIRAAGLPERCQAHGLRKAAARRLAEAGCSALEIGAVTGHKSLSEIERYTRAANQKKLARSAAAKQVRNGSVTTPAETEWQTAPETEQ